MQGKQSSLDAESRGWRNQQEKKKNRGILRIRKGRIKEKYQRTKGLRAMPLLLIWRRDNGKRRAETYGVCCVMHGFLAG